VVYNEVQVRTPVLRINEIFLSIQGESTFSGRPCVFVRLTGCDLRCSWCDTAHAFNDGCDRLIDDVVSEVDGFDCDLVEITGGEPLLQEDAYALMERLLASGKTVLLETGGHRSLARVPDAVVKIVDIKCPRSGESHTTNWSNLARLGVKDEVKFVIADRADYDYAKNVLLRHDLTRRCGAVLFSPAHGVLGAGDLAAWVLADRLPVRLQLQLHKVIWGPEVRGV
jgi:7-carboxy-7-deazaguanine synthase